MIVSIGKSIIEIDDIALEEQQKFEVIRFISQDIEKEELTIE